MFQRNQNTLDACAFMRSQNGFVSYEALANHFGQPIQDLRPLIQRAVQYLERDEGIVFETVRGKGFQRLSDEDKVESLETFARKIGRVAGKGVLRSGTVSDPNALTNESQMRLNIKRTVLETVRREVSE